MKQKIPNGIFLLLGTLAMFLGFYRNQWHVTPPGKFREFQHDSESLVMGRIVESKQSGLFSHGALMGRGNVDADDYQDGMDTIQYDTYLQGLKFYKYQLYLSQSGVQALLFSFLDQISPFPPH